MFAVLPCQLAMAHACRKWQDHGISLNWTGRSEDTEGTGVRVGVWMRQGAPSNFVQAIRTCSRLFWKGYRILQKKYRASVRSNNEKGSRILAGQVTRAARTTSLYELGITWQRPGYCIT